MVAISGTGWRLAPALVRLVDETDRLFPGRSQTSDGSIGDTAHASRDSDHNPDDGWVDAVDLTDDDAYGCDVGLLAHHLVAKRDPRVSYLIHKGTIWRGYDKPGLPAFTPQPYTGVNAHEHHLHVSIADDHRSDTAAWWPQSAPRSEEDDTDMLIIKASGKSTRLLAPPAFMVIKSEDTRKSLVAAGVKMATISGDEYEALRKQIVRALDEDQ